MGLFGGHKCSFCGSDHGFLTNTELKDGNICDECLRKVSKLFTVDSKTAVDTLRQYLNTREEKLKGFTVSKTYALKDRTLYIDKKAGLLAVARSGDGLQGSGEVFALRDLQDIRGAIGHVRDEKKHKNGAGDMVSYDPPVFESKYDFSLELDVKNDTVSGTLTLPLSEQMSSDELFELILCKDRLTAIVNTLEELQQNA